MTTPTSEVVIGADIGGSTTRVAVARTDGTVLVESRGGPGNPAGVGLAGSTATVRAAIGAGLSAAADVAGPVTVRRTVIGLAGVTALRGSGGADGFVAAALPDAAGAAGAPVRLVSDFAVAFASGTWRDHGIVTIAGTGSGASEIDRGAEVARRDGWGWLLGDDGSGFWLGREAVRSTLQSLQQRRPPGALARAVTGALGADTAEDLVAACYRQPPRDLAGLAPLVAAAAAEDPAAALLLDRAADLVSARVDALRAGRTALPVVLAGGLLAGAGPLAGRVRDRLAGQGVTTLVDAGDGVAGALWLALRTEGSDSVTDTVEPPRQWSVLLGSLGACRRTSSDRSEP